jgi:hypothetical protein
MRKSTSYLVFMGGMAVLLGCLVHFYPLVVRDQIRADWDEKAKLVKSLGLTDLCLLAEATYTRHLSQADLLTPFQDHPMAMEHFPAGSLVRPPLPEEKSDATMD